MRSVPVVVGIGEILWDVFPEGKKLGGAPLNFSHHCGQLGATAHPVSAVGADADGTEIRLILASKNLPDAHVQTDTAHPTGRVNVTLQNGKPTYEILAEVAWDYIRFDQNLRDLASRADAVCFGSLAQRSPVSRATIQAFLEAMRPEALRIFDVNLRQNFYSKEILETSLRYANIFKLSDEELPTLAGFFDLKGQVSTQLQRLREMFDLRLVAYTRGGEGSLLVTANETSDHPGFPAEVIDTVGAGDSFTATLCMGVLQNLPLAEINQRACQVAAFVCSQSGATPSLPPQIANL
ncbi:MAG: carbohydrate kinase [Spartobacteria bacterium]|nr:carbohydrate kinase [Spartobacteria bacterium]